MKRYRFHEIIKAHQNGEDLSKFVPKNVPEANLIAELQGKPADSEDSSSGSGMPDFAWNNPDLPNLYYGMSLKGKKLKLNLRKAYEALYSYGDVEELFSLTFNTLGSLEKKVDHLFQFCAYLAGNSVVAPTHIQTCIVRIGPSAGGISVCTSGIQLGACVPLDNNDDRTIGEIFDELGVIEVDFDTYIKPSYNSENAMLLGVGIKSNGSTYLADLNENPIDWLWFE